MKYRGYSGNVLLLVSADSKGILFYSALNSILLNMDNNSNSTNGKHVSARYKRIGILSLRAVNCMNLHNL